MKKIILNAILFALYIGAAHAQQKITIEGTYSSLKKSDTVLVQIYNHPELPPIVHLIECQNIVLANNKLKFSYIPKTTITHIEVLPKDGSLPSLSLYLEKGKSSSFSEQKGKYEFIRENAKQYNIVHHLQELSAISNNFEGQFKTENLEKILTKIDSSIFRALNFLSENRSAFNISLYNLLKSNAFYGIQSQKDNLLMKKAGRQPDSAILILKKIYQEHQIIPEISRKIQTDKLQNEFTGSNFPLYVYGKYRLDSCFFALKPFSDAKYLDYVNQKYSGKLLVPLSVYALVYQKSKSKDNLKPYINRLIPLAEDPFYKDFLNGLNRVYYEANILNYSLTDQNNRKINLNDFLGKTIVFDFWYTGCGNCRELAPILSKIEEDYKDNKEVVFLSISIDKVKQRWLNSVSTHQYGSTLSTNLYTSGNGNADPIIKELNIQGFPTMFIIDKRGHLTPNFNDLRDDNGQDFINKLERVLKQ